MNEAFSSFSEFVDRAVNGATNLRPSLRSSRQAYNNEWAGGSWPEVTDIARRGWKEGAVRVAQMAQPVMDSISGSVRRPETVMDVEGGDIDIGTYMTGAPDCFLRWDDTDVPLSTPGKLVRVVVNCSASAAFSAEQLFLKGAAVCALVDALELSGRRAIVDVVNAVHDLSMEKTWSMSVTVKRAEDPLNMESIAFACAHAGMLRRLVFSVQEQQSPTDRRKFGFDGSHYGVPTEVADREADVYIGASRSDATQSPLSWAMAQLKRLGVEFNS